VKTRVAGAAYNAARMGDQIEHWLRGFELDAGIQRHVADVLVGLPAAVLQDLLGDPGFRVADYDPRAGSAVHVRVALGVRGRPGRSVLLKRTLLGRPVTFVRWVIAHELAHAHLRNAGRWPGEDPEHAADALAAEWGFPRPVAAYAFAG
jgi:hypothetical protein